MGASVVDQDENQNEKRISLPNNVGKPLPKKLKYITAAVLFYGAIALGCSFNTYGPVSTSMQNKYDTNDKTISRVFTILTASYMVGALAAGIIFNYVNRQLAVIVIASTQAIIMFLTPHCPTLTTFFVSAAIMGLACGAYDTAQVVWMMEMLQIDCPPFVQSQHFFYAVGSNLASLVMAPFLDEEEDEDTTTKSILFAQEPRKSEETDGEKLFIPYTIIGVLCAVHAAAQILLFIFMRYYPPPPEQFDVVDSSTSDEKKSISDEKPGFKIGSWSLAKLRLVILSGAFYGAYVGGEMTTFQFFPKFGQNSDLALSESESTYVLTGMTAAYAVGRAIAIVAVFKISTQLILCGNIALVLIANILLIGWAQTSLPVLWAAAIIFGFGFSSMYASFSAYIERYMMFTNFIGSVMVVAGSGVAALYPVIIGESIEDNPIVMSYTMFFSIGLFTCAFATLSYLTHKDKTRY